MQLENSNDGYDANLLYIQHNRCQNKFTSVLRRSLRIIQALKRGKISLNVQSSGSTLLSEASSRIEEFYSASSAHFPVLIIFSLIFSRKVLSVSLVAGHRDRVLLGRRTRNRLPNLESSSLKFRGYRFYCSGVTARARFEIAFHFKFDTSWERWKNRQATLARRRAVFSFDRVGNEKTARARRDEQTGDPP